VAFEFTDAQSGAVLKDLEEREGRNFELTLLPVKLTDGRSVRAIVPLYAGPNIVELKTIDEMVRMILRAKGEKGICADYVKQVAAQLERLGINDAAVTSLAKAIPASK
jgi:cation transport regulator ChaC